MTAHLDDCGGNGSGECPVCEGQGWIAHQMSDDYHDVEDSPCSNCKTTGRVKCPACVTRAPSAEFSRCTVHQKCTAPSCFGRLYRYLLRWPTGVDNDRVALLIAANPSTADATQLDPTLTRWRNYCHTWGYGWSWTVNIRAWRATNPKDVPRDDATAIGPENWNWIKKAVGSADRVVCGWGKLGGVAGEGTAIALRATFPGIRLHALKLNRDGSPAHPLYLPANLMPVVWTPRIEEP